MATPTVIPAKQLYRAATKAELARYLSKRESGWCIEDSTLYIKKEDGSLAPVVPAQDLVDIETTARRMNDELLQQQIEDVAVQTDWEQDDVMALDYLKNKPTTITDAEIETLFI